MKEKSSFKDFFIDGFKGNVDFLNKKENLQPNHLDNAFKLLENVFIKMSEKNETEEELLYKK